MPPFEESAAEPFDRAPPASLQRRMFGVIPGEDDPIARVVPVGLHHARTSFATVPESTAYRPPCRTSSL